MNHAKQTAIAGGGIAWAESRTVAFADAGIRTRFDIRLLDKPLDEGLQDAQALQRAGQLDVLLAASRTGDTICARTLASPLVQIKVSG